MTVLAAVFRRASACLATVAALLAAMVLPAAQPAAAVLSCPANVMVAGDSTVAMQGAFDRYRQLLDQAGCVTTELHNAGVGTKGVGDVQVAAPFLMNAVRPDLVILMIGTNDSVDNYQARFSSMVQAFRDANSNVKMLISMNQCPSTPPAPAWINMPYKNNAAYGATFDMGAGRFRPNIAGYVSNDKIPSSLMNTTDGFHPTAEAIQYIQEYYYDATAVAYGLPRYPINPRATGGRCS